MNSIGIHWILTQFPTHFIYHFNFLNGICVDLGPVPGRFGGQYSPRMYKTKVRPRWGTISWELNPVVTVRWAHGIQWNSMNSYGIHWHSLWYSWWQIARPAQPWEFNEFHRNTNGIHWFPGGRPDCRISLNSGARGRSGENQPLYY